MPQRTPHFGHLITGEKLSDPPIDGGCQCEIVLIDHWADPHSRFLMALCIFNCIHLV